MKLNKMMAIASCALLACSLSSCRLALENAEAIPGEDKLIGVYITTEYLDLFDWQSYLSENRNDLDGGEIPSDGIQKKYEGKLYAQIKPKIKTSDAGVTKETNEYVFPGSPGFGFFATTQVIDGHLTHVVEGDPAFSDVNITSSHSDDKSSELLECTIYVSQAERLGPYFANPVYQSGDGQVYLTSGDGITASFEGSGNDDAGMTKTIDWEYEVNENGKSKSESVSIKIHFRSAVAPEKTAVLQMDGASDVISRLEFLSSALPESIALEKDAAYIVVESISPGSEISRDIYGTDDESIYAFILREDGILVKKGIQANWPE
ncbi:MAG: hypothetical protein LBU32_27010 [Clostridiales bacterium]|nr:hypothetical protein [Clostridiales bacterium]